MKIDLQMLSDEAAGIVELIDALDPAFVARFGEHTVRGLATIRGSFASKLLYAGTPTPPDPKRRGLSGSRTPLLHATAMDMMQDADGMMPRGDDDASAS